MLNYREVCATAVYLPPRYAAQVKDVQRPVSAPVAAALIGVAGYASIYLPDIAKALELLVTGLQQVCRASQWPRDRGAQRMLMRVDSQIESPPTHPAFKGHAHVAGLRPAQRMKECIDLS